MSLHSSFASAAAFSAALANDASSQATGQRGGGNGLESAAAPSLHLTQAIAGAAPGGAAFGTTAFAQDGTAAGDADAHGNASGASSAADATAGGVAGSSADQARAGGAQAASAAAARSSASLLAPPFRKVLSARHLQEQPHLQRLIDVVVQACTQVRVCDHGINGLACVLTHATFTCCPQNAAAGAMATCVSDTVAAARAAAANNPQSGTKSGEGEWCLVMALG